MPSPKDVIAFILISSIQRSKQNKRFALHPKYLDWEKFASFFFILATLASETNFLPSIVFYQFGFMPEVTNSEIFRWSPDWGGNREE